MYTIDTWKQFENEKVLGNFHTSLSMKLKFRVLMLLN